MQLVRDGSGEACAQLLVGGHVAGVARVQDRLASAVDLVGDRERSVIQQRVGCGDALLEAAKQLACPPTRRDDTVVFVEDDDDLAALLDERAAASRLEAKLLQPRVRPGPVSRCVGGSAAPRRIVASARVRRPIGEAQSGRTEAEAWHRGIGGLESAKGTTAE